MSNAVRDEQGAWSSARIGMWTTLAFTGWYIVTHDKPDAGVLSLCGSALLGFMAWAGGPRMAQYIAPQIGAVAQGIASSKGYVANEWAQGDPHDGVL